MLVECEWLIIQNIKNLTNLFLFFKMREREEKRGCLHYNLTLFFLNKKNKLYFSPKEGPGNPSYQLQEWEVGSICF